MAYDEALAQRIRDTLDGRRGVTERKMFGGIAFMLGGHMLLGVSDRSLMARVGPDNYEGSLGRRGVREMDFTGKPMRGYVYVAPEALADDTELAYWIQLCADFVGTLPAKEKS